VITDAIWSYYPALVSGKARWLAGSLFWDPDAMAGIPSLARGEIPAGPIYLLLSTLLPVAVALSWTAAVHLFLGCLFTYLFLRELGARLFGALVGAVAFGFNGYLIGWLSLPTGTNTMVWLPLLFWSVERALRRQDWRWALLGALGFTAQVASGNIVWPFYGAITLGLYVLYRSVLVWFAERNLRASLRPPAGGSFWAWERPWLPRSCCLRLSSSGRAGARKRWVGSVTSPRSI
jgi:hypothetical protein